MKAIPLPSSNSKLVARIWRTSALLLALLVSWELGQRALAPWALSDQRRWLSPNDVLRLSEAKPAAATSIVIFLSRDCHYCKEQAGFYRALLSATAGRGVVSIAALPQMPSAARSYLDGLGIKVDQVVRERPSAAGIPALPALVLLGPGGRVRARWFGALGMAQQEGVFRQIGLASNRFHTSSADPGGGVSAAATPALLRRTDRPTVLDIRTQAFARAWTRSSRACFSASWICVRTMIEV